MKTKVDCSLIINVASGDVPILPYTIPHILLTHKATFAEVIIAVDERAPTGRIKKAVSQYSVDELYRTLNTIQQQGFAFRLLTVNYEHHIVNQIFLRWFGHTKVTLKCAAGTPIYPFLFGLEQATHDLRLHLDSDMLIHDPGPISWVNKAIDILNQHEQVLFVSQAGGPHHPSNILPEHIAPLNRRLALHIEKGFSTRSFLLSMKKLQQHLLPLTATKYSFPRPLLYWLQGRSPYMALEQMITQNLQKNPYWRCDLERSWGFTLHAAHKKYFCEPEIAVIIKRIEQGDIPLAQCGYFDLIPDAFITGNKT